MDELTQVRYIREDQIYAMQCKSCMIIVIFLFNFYLKQKDCNKLCFYITNTCLTDPSMALILTFACFSEAFKSIPLRLIHINSVSVAEKCFVLSQDTLSSNQERV